MRLKGKVAIITGASRGIGLAIAVGYAKAGAQVVVMSKDSPANMEAASAQIADAGGRGLMLNVDIADAGALKEAVDQAAGRFGGIDVLVNNTSATYLSDSLHTTPEQFDLMIATSARAAFFLSKACYPYLKNASNPHIINISPPLNMDAAWFKDQLGFSIAKYAMSLCTLGLAEEFKEEGIAVNSLWPETTIATQTIKDLFSPKVYAASRWPSIMGDAAYELAPRPSRTCTGRFFTDEALLRETGVIDFSHYAVDPSVPLMAAFYIEPTAQRIPVSRDLYRS